MKLTLIILFILLPCISFSGGEGVGGGGGGSTGGGKLVKSSRTPASVESDDSIKIEDGLLCLNSINSNKYLLKEDTNIMLSEFKKTTKFNSSDVYKNLEDEILSESVNSKYEFTAANYVICKNFADDISSSKLLDKLLPDRYSKLPKADSTEDKKKDSVSK